MRQPARRSGALDGGSGKGQVAQAEPAPLASITPATSRALPLPPGATPEPPATISGNATGSGRPVRLDGRRGELIELNRAGFRDAA